MAKALNKIDTYDIAPLVEMPQRSKAKTLKPIDSSIHPLSLLKPAKHHSKPPDNDTATDSLKDTLQISPQTNSNPTSSNNLIPIPQIKNDSGIFLFAFCM